jgi:hypothetical protein
MLSMARTLLGWAIMVLVVGPLSVGCHTGDSSDTTPESWTHTAHTVFGTYSVQWRTMDGAPIPNNLPFQAIALVQRVADGTNVPDAEVVFQGDMPGHGHGMLREPRATELGDGLYLIDGILLHMAGRWVVHMDVIEGGKAERSTFTLDVD